jgi:hypothetical protein
MNFFETLKIIIINFQSDCQKIHINYKYTQDFKVSTICVNHNEVDENHQFY